MLEVSYIQNNCHNLSLRKCIREFVAGPGLLRLECSHEKLGTILDNGGRFTAVPKHHIQKYLLALLLQQIKYELKVGLRYCR